MHYTSGYAVLSILTSLADAFPGMKASSASAKRATFPYSGAQNGLPGSQRGGILVPDPADTAHAFVPPGPGDIRGACTGLNLLANHNFIAHNGIANYQETLDAAQNVYNFGYDLAQVLSTAAIIGAGDVNTKLYSIGGDQTARTAPLGGLNGLLGPEGGINWHDHVEADASLFRNDYYLANGDNYSLNTTLFKILDQSCGGVFTFQCVADFKYGRYQDSLQRNPNFLYGIQSFAFSGVSSFLYNLFPNYGDEGVADVSTIASIFGIQKSGTTYTYIPERLPPNWHSRPTPYTVPQLASDILALYQAHPVTIGGKTSSGSFNFLPYNGIQNGNLETPDVNTVICLLYQFAIFGVRPSTIGNIAAIPTDVLNWAVGNLNPIFQNYGCPLVNGRPL